MYRDSHTCVYVVQLLQPGTSAQRLEFLFLSGFTTFGWVPEYSPKFLNLVPTKICLLSLSPVEINECWVLCQALGGLLTLSDDLWCVSLSLWQLCRGEERLATALLGLSIEGLGMNWALLLCVSIIPTTDPGTSVPEAKEKDPLSKNHYH